MADSDVDIKISGDSTGAQQAFKQAADAAKEAVGSIGGAFEGIGGIVDTLKEHFASLAAILAGGAFFKEAISATKEFTGEVTQLSKQTGISLQNASGLNIALGDIGTNAETYTGALQKLTKQVRTNEDGLKSLGIATRGANGEYLDGQALMDSAIATLNTYKEGTDRNLAAQVAFGKGAADSAALLKLTTEKTEEGRQKAEELNLVIGPGTQAAVKAYKQAMNDVSDVSTGFEVTLGKEVIPVLADLTKWFASGGPAAIAVFKPAAAGVGDVLRMVGETIKELWTFFADAFTAIGTLFNEVGGTSLTFGDIVRNAFAVIGIALLFLKEAFLVAFEVIKTAINSVIVSIRAWTEIAAAAFHGDFAGAKAAYKAGLADIENEVKESAKRILKIDQDTADAQQKLAMGEGYKRPEDKDAEVKKPSGSRAFTEAKAKDTDTLMAQLEKELSDRKAALAAENALNGTFYQMSKRDEAEFWEESIGRADAGSKAQLQIQRKANEMKVADNMESYATAIATYDKDIAAAQYNYAAKLAIARQELSLVKQHFGDQGKEYQEGLAKITKLEQEQAAQSKAIAETLAQTKRNTLLAGIDIEQQQAELAVQLMMKSDAQLLAEEIGFENRRYAIQVEALQERMRLAATEKNPVEVAKVNGQLEQLEMQHQAKISQIQGQAAIQQGQFARSVFGSLQSGFANVVSGMLQGTLKMKDVMRQTFASIADALGQAVAKMVAQWIIGEVLKTAASKTANAEQIQAAAGEAAANAYNAIVGIPYVGPFLAPAAAAVAYAGVMAFAEGGYDVPAGVNPVTQLHQKEMVLPAKHADVIRTMADNGGGNGGGGGDTHFHVTAIDAKGVAQFFKDNGQHIVTSLNAQRRSFNGAS